MTTNQNASHIAALLHQTRSASWTSDRTLELSAAMKGQSAEVLACALLQYSQGLLRAAHGAVTIQLDCAITEQVIAERDSAGRMQ